MSAEPVAVDADDLVLGVLAPEMNALPSLVDWALHLTVLKAVAAHESLGVWDQSLRGHYPDPVTGRRVTALHTALLDMARSGTLQWTPAGWRLSPRARLAYLNDRATRLTWAQAQAVEAVRLGWQARRPAVAR